MKKLIDKKDRINKLEKEIKEYKDYINGENPLLKRLIADYKRYILKLEKQLTYLRKEE